MGARAPEITLSHIRTKRGRFRLPPPPASRVLSTCVTWSPRKGGDTMPSPFQDGPSHKRWAPRLPEGPLHSCVEWLFLSLPQDAKDCRQVPVLRDRARTLTGADRMLQVRLKSAPRWQKRRGQGPSKGTSHEAQTCWTSGPQTWLHVRVTWRTSKTLSAQATSHP